MPAETLLQREPWQRLHVYVDELLSARASGDELAVKGRLLLIANILEVMRRQHRDCSLNASVIAIIQAEKTRAALPPDFDSRRQHTVGLGDGAYENICWFCWRTQGHKQVVNAERHHVCDKCDWVICPTCNSCRDPQHGGECIGKALREATNGLQGRRTPPPNSA
jgi:hypothetical protein